MYLSVKKNWHKTIEVWTDAVCSLNLTILPELKTILTEFVEFLTLILILNHKHKDGQRASLPVVKRRDQEVEKQ